MWGAGYYSVQKILVSVEKMKLQKKYAEVFDHFPLTWKDSEFFALEKS